MKIKLLAVLSLVFAGICGAEENRPNIVFIMADDLGPGWVDLTGSSEKINTPNLERLARSGMVFTKAYAAAPVCSPTRAACITGMSPARVGYTTHAPGMGLEKYLWKNGGRGKGGPVDAESREFIPFEFPSYARELKRLGYATGFFGKWHLAGEGSVSRPDGVVNAAWHPEHYGFDVNVGGCAYGQPKSWFDPYRNATIEGRAEGEYLTDRLGDEAAEFIRANQEGPFHVTLWLYSVHTPIRAPADLVEKNGGDAYLAMLESMDTAVGKVIAALEETGSLENTLLVFYSDNGGWKPTEGLAEEKGSLLEGGVRVPMVVSWPKVIEPASESSVPVTSMDFFPTFVNAAGGDAGRFKELDGLDLMPLFEGGSDLGREALYWHFPHHRKGIDYMMGSSILEGDWKLYLGYAETGDALFNLRKDPGETNNVLDENPEHAYRLKKKLDAWLLQSGARMPRTDADFE
ncbi:sulfatase [Pelagicoccus sp. SDUM812005]|uniref:sulfatase n=1 Tax=Pelagicoccus sp. SDUM812005 TaxID=3041257 RepID=UPI00280EFD94|nr:sulfatase [Pelagicoccus sp. SDUM812005]MDQ8183504.1 sulfatase [Pelagicoccus sp. SDUM812005]